MRDNRLLSSEHRVEIRLYPDPWFRQIKNSQFSVSGDRLLKRVLLWRIKVGGGPPWSQLAPSPNHRPHLFGTTEIERASESFKRMIAIPTELAGRYIYVFKDGPIRFPPESRVRVDP